MAQYSGITVTLINTMQCEKAYVLLQNWTIIFALIYFGFSLAGGRMKTVLLSQLKSEVKIYLCTVFCQSKLVQPKLVTFYFSLLHTACAIKILCMLQQFYCVRKDILYKNYVLLHTYKCTILLKNGVNHANILSHIVFLDSMDILFE